MTTSNLVRDQEHVVPSRPTVKPRRQPRHWVRRGWRRLQRLRRQDYFLVPFTLTLLASALLATRLSHSVNATEVRVLHGSSAYSLLARLLDNIGGVVLIRTVNLACVLVAAVFVRKTTQHLFGSRAGMIGGSLFALTGPVIFVSHEVAPDAILLLLLSAVLWRCCRPMTPSSTLGIGLLLCLATAIKYEAVLAVPVACFMIAETSKPRRQALMAAIPSVTLLFIVQFGSSGTHLALQPLAHPASLGKVVNWYGTYLSLTAVLAGFGLFFILKSRGRRWELLLAFFITGLVLPITGRVDLGLQLGYSVLFLAPIAGWGVARWWRTAIATPLVFFVVFLSLIFGGFRAQALHDLTFDASKPPAPAVAPPAFTPPAPVSTSTPSVVLHHTVSRGETLAGIASQAGVPLAALYQANRAVIGPSEANLKIGTSLVIPKVTASG